MYDPYHLCYDEGREPYDNDDDLYDEDGEFATDYQSSVTLKANEKPTHFISATLHGDEGTRAAKYLDFLFSKESPYYPFLEKHKCKRLYRTDGSSMLYYHEIHEDTSSQLTVNFGIACRLPYENEEKLKTWTTLVDAGLHPAIAFAFMAIYRVRGDGLLVYSPYDPGHFPLNPTVNPELLLKQSPNWDENKTIAGGHTYLPNNLIWDGGYNSLGEHHKITAVKDVKEEKFYFDKFKKWYDMNYVFIVSDKGDPVSVKETVAYYRKRFNV